MGKKFYSSLFFSKKNEKKKLKKMQKILDNSKKSRIFASLFDNTN
jgi:hypothetical protein